MFSLEELIEEYKKGKKLKYLFFWGHQPKKDGSIGSSCFSQWWNASFGEDELTFSSTEHYMMYGKAILFNDLEMANKILDAKSPGQAKEFGRQVRGFKPDVWDAHKFEIVFKGNYLKFSQNEDLRAFLLNTKDRVLVEASPVDRIWGIGLTGDSEHAENPLKWRGENLLGFVLMKVRDKLK